MSIDKSGKYWNGFLNITARVLTGIIRIVPPGPHVFMYGIPGTEGNAVEVARAVTNLTDATIVWPGAPQDAYLDAVGIPAERIKRLPSTQSIYSMWAFVRAKAIFHTHGIYGCPVPSARKPIVNLWHGDSFKLGRCFPHRTLRGANATYLVAASQLMGKIKADTADTDHDRLLIVGNPRVAQMFSPPKPNQLVALGIDPNRPFVLWMPTYRIACDRDGNFAWSNISEPERDRELAADAGRIADQLRLNGINLVVKTHMLDATKRVVPGSVVLNNEILGDHNVPLYSLLGASAGLISDYSSVWVDYLAVDRPIAFLINDLEDYQENRGIAAPELIAEYPGERIESGAGLSVFIEDVKAGGKFGHDRRERFKETIGYADFTNSAAVIVRSAMNLR